MQRVVISALGAAVVAMLMSPSLAQSGANETHLGGDKGWDAYTYTEKGDKVCYLYGALKEKPAAGRGRVDLYITHRQHQKSWNVVHFDAGYAYKAGSTAELAIDKLPPFKLFIVKDTAWANDPAEDKQVTKALGAGHRAILKGTPEKGAATADRFDLDGLAAALELIDKACAAPKR
jgi:hypothetical protein